MLFTEAQGGHFCIYCEFSNRFVYITGKIHMCYDNNRTKYWLAFRLLHFELCVRDSMSLELKLTIGTKCFHKHLRHNLSHNLLIVLFIFPYVFRSPNVVFLQNIWPNFNTFSSFPFLKITDKRTVSFHVMNCMGKWWCSSTHPSPPQQMAPLYLTTDESTFGTCWLTYELNRRKIWTF